MDLPRPLGTAEILRRSAAGWNAGPLPQTLWTCQDLTAVAGAAWMVGEDDTGLKVPHYDGSRWTARSTPDGVRYLLEITARTATGAWAWVGISPATAQTPSWQHVPVPAQVRPQAGLNEAVAFGPDQAWAVGADAVGREAPGFPLVLRWDGTA
ncbi:hypothetical protein ACWCQ0_42575 [Streptomyces massasporeus]|uniref:Uncharacterized protein n=1 Tax=Streptomyces massasporeus TaxID=67324 RepID=A0ABW6LLB9_9ACTN